VSRLAFLFRDSALYGGATAVSRAVALLTFPVLAQHFSVSEYGVLDFMLLLVSLTANALVFGQDSAVARFFYEHQAPWARRQLISQSLSFQVVCVAVCLPALWWWSGPLARTLVGSSGAESLFRIVLLQIPCAMVINFAQNLLKWTFARRAFLTLSLGFTLVQAVLVLTAVLRFDAGLRGVLLVNLTTAVLFACVGLWFVRGWLVRPRGVTFLRELIPYAAPYGVICILAALSPTLERSLTANLLGAEQLGLYAAGAKIAALMALASTAFQTAWGPFALSIYRHADAPQTYNLVLKVFAIAASVLVLTLSGLAGPVVTVLASDRYSAAAVVVFPLTLALAVQATSWILEVGISLSKRSGLNLFGYAASVLVTLGTIALAAPRLGLLGVGLGVLGGHAAKAGVSAWLAQRVYPLPWSYWSVMQLLVLTVLGGVSGEWALYVGGPRLAVLVYGAWLPIVLLVAWSLVLSGEDRSQVRRLWVGIADAGAAPLPGSSVRRLDS
jgi:O-antigen/teichoic acid export membrane protein